MSERSLQGLLTVLEHERRQRDAARQAHREAADMARQAVDQAQALVDYRRETAARWAAPGGAQTHVDQLLATRRFLDRLDDAIAQQDQVCRRAEAAREHQHQELLQAERRLAAIGKLIDRRRHATRQAADRREQRSSDELAQRRRSADVIDEPDPHDEPAHADEGN